MIFRCCVRKCNSQNGGEEGEKVREMKVGRDTEDTYQGAGVGL